jgi:TolB-like protein/tetratricopeptide (TPR) repeat protein
MRRRRVLRTASYYVVGAWLLMQVADIVIPALELPESAMRYLLFALSLGFPVSLLAGWFLDITATGIRVTQSTEEELPPLRLQDYATLVVVVFVAGVIIYSFWPTRPSTIPIPGAVAVMPFTDEADSNGHSIGESLAVEIIGSLKRVPGLWVPGQDSSFRFRDLDPLSVGQALKVGAILTGSVHRSEGHVEIIAELFGTGDGRRIWSSSFEGPFTDLLQTQTAIVDAIVTTLSPTLDSRPTQESRMQTAACSAVYDKYLRARHLTRTDGIGAYEIRAKGIALLTEAVDQEPNCALAWAGLATAHVAATPTSQGAQRFERGLMPAAAAARRALELDDSLAEAWIVLAEIAEQNANWIESEDMFLKALYAEPTDPMANAMYSEALAARGRVNDALHYGLEAYRYDPASRTVAFKVALAAKMSGDAERAIEFGTLMKELSERAWYDGFAEIARGYMLKGEVDRALEIYRQYPELVPEWFLGCAQAQADPSLLPQASADLITANQESEKPGFDEWWIIVCGTWLVETDLVVDLLLGSAEGEILTEAQFFPWFFPEAKALRQNEGFRALVVDSGLLDYWRVVAWSDYCQPDGDSFKCN